MIDMSDLLREHIKKRIRSGALECPKEECDSRAFDIRVWKNAQEIPEGAAVCHKCDSRIEITMSKSELKKLQEPLDELEDELDDLQKELDNL